MGVFVYLIDGGPASFINVQVGYNTIIIAVFLAQICQVSRRGENSGQRATSLIGYCVTSNCDQTFVAPAVSLALDMSQKKKKTRGSIFQQLLGKTTPCLYTFIVIS